MRPHEKHRAGGQGRLRFVVATVSSSRYLSKLRGREFEDESGDVAEKRITGLGHGVLKRLLISDDARMIAGAVKDFLGGEGDVLTFLGGTGVSKRDVTVETVRPYFEKELEGFGELLRSSSFAEIGAAAMLTRATAGVAKGKVILCIPGSPDAVRRALEMFGGELPHVLFVARS
ncbi:MAG: molybdenum cofactor biosynthesis protein B [Nitrososphaerales archaeon]